MDFDWVGDMTFDEDRLSWKLRTCIQGTPTVVWIGESVEAEQLEAAKEIARAWLVDECVQGRLHREVFVEIDHGRSVPRLTVRPGQSL